MEKIKTLVQAEHDGHPAEGPIKDGCLDVAEIMSSDAQEQHAQPRISKP